MIEVIRKLNDVLELAEKKLIEIVKKEALLEVIKKREEAVDLKEKEISKRFLSVSHIENVAALEKKISEVSTQNLKDKEILEDEKRKFLKSRNEETQKLKTKEEEQREIQVNIDKGLAELQRLKENYKKEVLAELAKK